MPFIGALLPAIIGGVAAGGVGALAKGLGGKKKASSAEQQAETIAKEKWDMQKGAINETSPFLSSFYGGKDIKSSPFYQSLVRTGTQSTAAAYDQAKSSLKRNANVAGFGYEQPVYQGAETSLKGEEASELARVPEEAMQTAADYGQRAAQIRTAQAGVVDPDQALGISADMENERLKRRQNLWSSIAGGALKLLPMLTGQQDN